MKVYPPSQIRNVAVVGHNDTGKTTLVSALLFNAGMVNRLGKVEDGTTVTDFESDEIERRISISSALAYAEWQKNKINFIDAPGYGIFSFEARSALRVADCALITAGAVSGVEVQTEKMWAAAAEFGIPILFVVTKMDRENANFGRVFETLCTKFGRTPVMAQLPVGEGKEFKGVIDLVANKAYLYRQDFSGKFEVAAIPSSYADAAKAGRDKLIEMVAEGDDTLLERYFESGTLSEGELIGGLARAVAARRIAPVLMTSAVYDIGGPQVLDALTQWFPAADARAEMQGVNPISGQPIQRSTAIDAAPSAFAFKTISDPYAGRITLLRVCSGTLKSDSTLWNSGKQTAERVGSLTVLQGKQPSAVTEAQAGDLVAITKLKETATGDTLSDKEHPIVYPALAIPEPAISFAIEPKTKGDEDKIGNALHKIRDEDPTLLWTRDTQTKEMVLSGAGQLHIEVVVGKLKKRYGVEVILHPPKVPYRETISRRAEATARHKKQSGGHGQFAECKIAMEPTKRGEGYQFVDKIFGGSISHNYRPAVDKGIQDSALRGYLAGYPVVDFKVTLLDGKEHDVDSSEMAFKIAGSQAFKACMQSAGATLLEPIMKVDIEAPTESMGEVMGDLTSRRGRMLGMDSDTDRQVIHSTVPLAEMLSYSPALRSITSGRGSFHMEFSHYEEVPKQLQERLIGEIKKRQGEEEEE